MTNDLSSTEDFLQFLIQLKHQSSLLHVSGNIGRLNFFEVLGRVVSTNSDCLKVRGRGCEMEFFLSGAKFDCVVPKDLPQVPIRTQDPEWLFRPEWRAVWRNGDTILFGERSF